MRRPTDTDHSGPPLAPYAPPVQHVPGGSFGSPPPLPGPIAAASVPTILGLLNALKRRWVLASFLGLLVGLAGAAGVWIAFPTGKHVVRSLLLMSPDTNPVDRGNYDSNFDNWKQDQVVLIKTRGLLTKVAKDKQVADLAFIKNNDDPAKWIEDQIRHKWTSPGVLEISMNGDNPEQLRVVVSALVKEYANEANNAQRKDRLLAVKSLEKAQKELEQDILGLEHTIKALGNEGMPLGAEGASATIARLQARAEVYDQRVDEHETRLREVNAKLAECKGRLNAADVAAVPPDVLDAELEKNPAIAELKALVEREKIGLQTLMSSLVDQTSPSIAKKKQAVQDAEQKLEAAKKSERNAAEKRIRTETRIRLEAEVQTNLQLKNLQEQMLDGVKQVREQLESRIKLLTQKGVNGTLDLDKLKPMREQFARLEHQIREAKMLAGASGRVAIQEDATIIPNFNLKQKMMFSAAVAVVGFIGIMVLVAYLEWRSRRVDGVEQVVGELGMRVLGTIPAFPSRASLKAGEADQNQNWRFILNESVNSTRTMLLHTAKTQQMQVIMVTSAMQGEGKTSLASQLATSMATAGLRTLILDCDLRNPSMHRLFDVPLSPGCSEILCAEVDSSDAVQPTSVPNLWLIPAGQCSNRVVAALAQGHPLESLFNRLRGQFDFIVVDSCPVLPVADALLIGQHVDGAVISILQDISQLPKVQNASERLTQLNIPLLGAVVNGIKTDVHAYGYNYVKQLPA